MKKAILVVSFGTSDEDTRRKTIDVIEKKIAKEYPEYQVYRAFTSNIIIRKLRNCYNTIVPTVAEAMKSLVDKGFTEVIVQPTHIINGIEYEKMLEEIEPYRARFEVVRIGKPLLSDTTDYKELVNCIVSDNHVNEQEAILLMGHGTSHHANAVYPAIDYTFRAEGYSQVYMATVKGYPTLEDAIGRMKQRQYTKVLLLPFMIVAGDHAKNDMACDEEYSWKSILLREGYEVDCKMQGLGELEVVQEMFIRHIVEAE
ncbi:sirohydrochlorin cobaltochelatase [Anaerosporobacter faecicola]|uniref:sirohydrochlorin cobaltochelatase n=1 Tax=Anaerosporobacter faecicola TaxID=2718714 RepID=UPI00143A75FE|nr:sirohydrochlorin cobaltochelatase [Anaerosporobacter faecicola]